MGNARQRRLTCAKVIHGDTETCPGQFGDRPNGFVFFIANKNAFQNLDRNVTWASAMGCCDPKQQVAEFRVSKGGPAGIEG